MNWNEHETGPGICRRCGSDVAQATADAISVGFRGEFLAGEFTCCQIVQWADEQWLAWHDAAVEDGKPVEDVTRPLEVAIAKPHLKGDLPTNPK